MLNKAQFKNRTNYRKYLVSRADKTISLRLLYVSSEINSE